MRGRLIAEVCAGEEAVRYAAVLLSEESTDSRFALVDALHRAANALEYLRFAIQEAERAADARAERVRAAPEDTGV